MDKVVIITGLTASGKSGLAVEIAKKYNGEIISADSVQIYKGLDIGSAKEDEKIRNQIKHHLIDIKEFYQTYSVGDFVSDCKSAIKDIISRNKLPIIVGGTGLYIKALLNGYSLGERKSNLEFREKYQEIAKEKGVHSVWEELNNINPQKAMTVHENNVKRVIRYLEIEKFGTPDKGDFDNSLTNSYRVLAVGIIANREEIYQKINNRVDVMIKDGLKKEVESLVSHGATRDMQAFNSIGYKEWFDCFDGQITEQETIDLIKQHTRNYCKRQLTFLKTINGIKLCDSSQARKEIEDFINDKN